MLRKLKIRYNNNNNHNDFHRSVYKISVYIYIFSLLRRTDKRKSLKEQVFLMVK